MGGKDRNLFNNSNTSTKVSDLRRTFHNDLDWTATTDLRTAPPEFLQGDKQDAELTGVDATLIVFINTRSGGRVGTELARVLARAVQVYDLSVYRPDEVLQQVWSNLQQQEQLGNPAAALVRSRVRILACGGDGTIAWILKTIRQLDLQPHPAVAIMPLGTGNDMSRSLHWGAKFEPGWIKNDASVKSILKKVADARVSDLDCWRLRLLLPNGSCMPAKAHAISAVEQPQQQDVMPQHGCAGNTHSVLMEGIFWNYFSVGADAQAAYNFHHLRENHPKLASNRIANQFWYSAFSCTSGWFCGAVPSVSSFSRVEVLQPGSSSWSTLAVPSAVKALVLVNLQSYAGGRNIWGEQRPKGKGRWTQPSFSDGLIEVVGFHSGYHAMATIATGAKVVNGKRMAQVAGIRLALRDTVPRPDGESGHVFVQLDGEPWLQKVPAGNTADQVVLEVVHAGVSKVLCNATHVNPDSEHGIDLMSKQQAATYLTACSRLEVSQAEEPPQHLQQGQQQQKQQLQAHLDGAQSVQAPGVLNTFMGLPSEAHNGFAALSSSCPAAAT